MGNFWKNPKKQFKKLRTEIRVFRHAEDDLLTEKTREELDELLGEINPMPLPDGAEKLESIQSRYNKITPPYRHRSIRAFLDLFLVVGAVAFGIRALYFQPFRIPTSSMQPTLYGIHYIDGDKTVNPLLAKLPSPLNALLFSVRPAKAEVSRAGQFNPDSFGGSSNLLYDNTYFKIGGASYRLPGAPAKVAEYADLEIDRTYQPGDKLADGYLSLGDHLAVERWSIYLTDPKRGDVMVFTTDGLTTDDGRSLTSLSGFFYIKRLAGLPGDTLKIINHTLHIKPEGEQKFRPVYEIEPRFEKLYSGKGGYHGHLNGMGSLIADPSQEYVVPQDHYFMLGDNSRFSLDSRFFGAVPRRNLVGKAWVTFWPFSRRWGFCDSAGPVDVPTGYPAKNTYPIMYLQ